MKYSFTHYFYFKPFTLGSDSISIFWGSGCEGRVSSDTFFLSGKNKIWGLKKCFRIEKIAFVKALI